MEGLGALGPSELCQVWFRDLSRFKTVQYRFSLGQESSAQKITFNKPCSIFINGCVTPKAGKSLVSWWSVDDVLSEGEESRHFRDASNRSAYVSQAVSDLDAAS